MPRRGSRPASAGSVLTGANRGGVEWTFHGRAVVDRYMGVIQGGLERSRRRMETYWRTEEWTEARHPYMRGTERDSGYFQIAVTGARTLQLVLGVTAPWAMFEEFGTSRQPAHYPLRNTMDRYGYRVPDAIREEARAQGLA